MGGLVTINQFYTPPFSMFLCHDQETPQYMLFSLLYYMV